MNESHNALWRRAATEAPTTPTRLLSIVDRVLGLPGFRGISVGRDGWTVTLEAPDAPVGEYIVRSAMTLEDAAAAAMQEMERLSGLDLDGPGMSEGGVA